MAKPQCIAEFRRLLPGDPSAAPHPRQVHGALWSPVQPTPVAAPQLLAFSRPLAATLGLDPALFEQAETTQVLAGNQLWPGMAPYAANYGGHQFGHWAGQLGDGRALVLGELPTAGGRVELQLKGAGPTPYSRAGDGRAVLRSSLREFVCSEAMHHLGVPTTRALSLVATGDGVVRDMFYDGRPRSEPGAIVCRVAPSFLRFGSYELPSARGDHALLRTLVEYTLRQHFPHLLPNDTAKATGREVAAWLLEVATRTARLIAHWQSLGFVHGVMNTDNLSILGLTIDYGPYGWLDDFDPLWTPNTTDAAQRRYCYQNQPGIGLWNVERLGLALLPLLDGDEQAIATALEHYRAAYAEAATQRFAQKVGLTFDAAAGDGALLQDLLQWLAGAPTDFTLWFRALGAVVALPEPPTAVPVELAAASYEPLGTERAAGLLHWLQRWWPRTRATGRDPRAIAEGMLQVNPWLVPRNWVAQEVIEAAEAGELGLLHKLLSALERPFTEQPAVAHWVGKRPEWARDKPGCSALSCSS